MFWVPVSASTVSVAVVGAPSSSVMVPVAVPPSIKAPALGALSFTRKVSSSSCSMSSVVCTVKVLLVSPAAKLST